MNFLVLAIIAIFAILIIFYIQRQKKLSKELEQNIQKYQEQINTFFAEYFELQKQFVSELEENNYTEKWQELYSEIQKYRISKKFSGFAEIEQFKKTYKNLHRSISESNAEIKRKKEIEHLAQQISDFFAELFEITNQYVSHSVGNQFTQKWKQLSQKVEKSNIHKDDDAFAEIKRFKTVYESLHDYFATANKKYIQNESMNYDDLFSSIDGKNLDKQQRTAVITDEDRILVLAGAGSGKTLTISAKVKYLCEVKNINPKDILLISFTKKSAQEMTERIQNKLGIETEASTFHKLGLDIIKNTDREHPEISDENVLNQFVHNFFERELLNHPDLINVIIGAKLQ